MNKLALYMMGTFLLFAGCQTNRNLEPGGAYSDVILYNADTIIDDTISTMEAFQMWAARNQLYISQNDRARQLLGKVNLELDGIANPDEILVQAVMARDLYAVTVSDKDLKSLQSKLTLVNELARALLPIAFPDGKI